MGIISVPPPVKRKRVACAYCRSAWREDKSGKCEFCGAPPQTRRPLPDWDDIPAGETQVSL